MQGFKSEALPVNLKFANKGSIPLPQCLTLFVCLLSETPTTLTQMTLQPSLTICIIRSFQQNTR